MVLRFQEVSNLAIFHKLKLIFFANYTCKIWKLNSLEKDSLPLDVNRITRTTESITFPRTKYVVGKRKEEGLFTHLRK